MINTLNESSLHRTLKQLYSLEDDFTTEEKVGQWICDITNANRNQIIEIQTSNVSKLKSKIVGLLSLEKKVKIVHPVIIEKTIETYDLDGKLLYRRKSPKKENIYSIFKQITGLTELLLHESFTLEIIEISEIETRIKLSQPTQVKNKARHHLKNWVKTDKKLKQIYKTHIFKTAKDYLNLLPQYYLQTSQNDFTVKQTRELLNLKNVKTNASLMVWVLKKMDLIEEIYKEKREIHYRISKDSSLRSE